MPDPDSSEQLSRSQFQQPNYFALDHNDFDKKSQVPPTGLLELDMNLQSLPYSQKQNESEIQKHVPYREAEPKPEKVEGSARQKKIISVGQKFRSGYMQAKKGHNEETNDLSINVCTLMRNFCDEYEKFEPMREWDQKMIREFKNGKSNIETLRKLMSSQQKSEPSFIFEESMSEEHEQGSKMRQFFTRKLQQTETVAKLLNNRKMSFNNKITFLKYLQVIKKSTQNPQRFKSWKNSDF